MTTVARPRSAERSRFPLPRPDEAHWPGLATPPRAPVHARIAEAIFRRAVAPLPVRVVLPGGRVLGAGSKDAPVMHLVRPAAFFARLGADVKIGFGEAYMAGDRTTGPGTDLADLLAPFAGRMASLVHPVLQRLRQVVERTQPDGHGARARGGGPDDARRGHGPGRGHCVGGGLPRDPRCGGVRGDEGGAAQPPRVARGSLGPRGIVVQIVAPGFVQTPMTDRNTFPMPFMVSTEEAARAIADGIARDKAEIVFPLPMMLLMKAARLVPVRAWTAATAAMTRRGMRR